jgi:purine-binding chemotaxis protein CheW
MSRAPVVPSPERFQAVLDARARALARPVEASRSGEQFDGVVFALGGERYAIESRYVVEVFRLKELALLPGAHPPAFAITAWRGELLPILDLRAILDRPTTALDDLAYVLVLGERRAAFGVLVDAALGVIALPVTELRHWAEGKMAGGEYLRGITRDAVLVLNAERIVQLHHR